MSLSVQVIGAAIEVHKALGPGLLESIYDACLCMEPDFRSVPHQKRQKEAPVEYRGRKLDCGYRLDLVAADWLIVELKACDAFICFKNHTPCTGMYYFPHTWEAY